MRPLLISLSFTIRVLAGGREGWAAEHGQERGEGIPTDVLTDSCQARSYTGPAPTRKGMTAAGNQGGPCGLHSPSWSPVLPDVGALDLWCGCFHVFDQMGIKVYIFFSVVPFQIPCKSLINCAFLRGVSRCVLGSRPPSCSALHLVDQNRLDLCSSHSICVGIIRFVFKSFNFVA
jgi:hypothetical protein